MPRTVAIGIQDFEKIRAQNYFYVDKTDFIREWWENGDDVTLITRPRRFGKTLLLNTVDRFFSNQYKDQAKWFEGLSIWEHEKFRELQGTQPVIFLSFADVKEDTYDGAVSKIKELISHLFERYLNALDRERLTEQDHKMFERMMNPEMKTTTISGSINTLAECLMRYYGTKPIILLDEYDTPMQEAYVYGYWEEITRFFRSFFNSTFKTNPYLGRALMTGITRVSRESMFSDLNNLNVVSTTTEQYQTAFGFTEEEVFSAMDEYGYTDRDGVRLWYDGFIFGDIPNIYNPWSIINYLKKGKLEPYWANTSGNGLASKLVREGVPEIKTDCEILIEGGTIHSKIDEQIVFGEMKGRAASVWSLLLASGYLKVVKKEGKDYELALTNYEVTETFRQLISRWFDSAESEYNNFTKALLLNDTDAMNEYMNRVSVRVFSSFDTGNNPSNSEPERFYHGFVLGLIVDLEDKYTVRSNRESGFGRYDVTLEPKDKSDNAYILEFKVFNPRKESDLEDTVAAAHRQIDEKRYAADLISRGAPECNIYKYGFAFRGKEVLIG